jgi:hypothetical protein
MKKKFTIQVVRNGYEFAEIEVEAESQVEAELKALDEAGDHLFNEKNVDYELST